MGEMQLVHHKENVPLIIIRPTMVTSTLKDPFPGWIEGLRYIFSILSQMCISSQLFNFLDKKINS